MQATRAQATARNRGAVVTAGAPETPLLGLFLRERERLRRIAAGMGMAGADVDDVLQDVSVQVLRHEGTFERESGMRSWLIRTTVNHCLTEHRRRFRHSAARIVRRRPHVAEHFAGCDVTDRVDRTEQLEVVRRTLLELDASQLAAMVLRYFCDLTSREIAETLGWKASTVRARLRQARMILARKLLQRGVEP